MDKKWRDRLSGGKADRKKPSDFDQEQLKIGIEVEREHTTSRLVAAEIAMDHLSEDPLYYQKLKKVEKEIRVPILGTFGESDMSNDSYGRHVPLLTDVFVHVGDTISEADDMFDTDDVSQRGRVPDDKLQNIMKAKVGGKKHQALQRRRAQAAQAKTGGDPYQMQIPGMEKVFGKKQQPTASSWQKQSDGRQPLASVKGKYLHVSQSLPLSPYFLQQTGHTYETLPGDMLKGTKIDANPGSQWGSMTYKIGDDGELSVASQHIDSSD